MERIVRAYLAAFGRAFTYDARRNVYLWFGFLWGIPIPVATIALDSILCSTPPMEAIARHPVHFFFLVHPILFALVFGAMGTVRHRLEEENKQLIESLTSLATTDALTGLHNRRYFHETLAREVARAQRYDRQLALIVFDLDEFKAINDRIGHLSGDAVLAETAERVRDVVRSADIACRVGGDEFAVILPESSTADADQLYHRLRGAVSSRPVGQAGRLSLSAGIADLLPDDDPTRFFERADEALYRAKELGKGQVFQAGTPGLSAAPDASQQPGTASSQ